MKSSKKILCVSTILLATSCQADNVSSETEKASENRQPQLSTQEVGGASRHVGASDKVVSIPSKFVFKQPSYPIRAKDWDELLKGLTSDDGAFLKEKNEQYFGVFEYGSEMELKERAASGFPLSDEWLAARAMSDQELKSMADAGNIKAKAFYLDRVLSEASPYLSLRGVNDIEFSQGKGNKLAMEAAERAMQIQSSYSGPFAGYQLGYAYSTLSYPYSPESAAAGMFIAMERGDRRALGYLQNYQQMHRNMDVSTVMAAYSSFK